MTLTKVIRRIGLISIFAALSSAAVLGQRPASTAPRQEKLLNGLKVLVWNNPASDKVTLRLRFHGGSAFDPQDREGVMKLVSDSFFPNNAAKEFFTDELGGSLEVICNYDYVQINASARTSEFLTMLETISTAIANPTLDKEAAGALKAALTAQVKELEKNPEYIADRAVAKRLFGTFPYGRPQMGTVDSIQKIDFADLRFARDRLLTADNATLALTGNVDTTLAFRAVRRYFGSWLKADKKIPSTFRQPDAPVAAQLDLTMAGLANSELRYAVRGFARSSKEFATAEIYSRILQSRFRDLVSKSAGSDASVSHDEHILPGAFVFRYRSQASPSGVVNTTIQNLFNQQITDAEFAAAKNEALAVVNQRDIAEWWLDVDTFKITSVADELKSFQNVTAADVTVISQKLSREPLASVALIKETPATSPTND
ncbi:MAG: pitrilysin family protein [Pyrinomonadaceae bacterium]